MKTLTITIVLALSLGACSEVQDDSKEIIPEEKTATTETVNTLEVVVFESKNANGTVEYLELHDDEKGTREWYYSTKKRPTKILLGVTERSGLEVIFFKNKPKELYTIGGSECGFSLIDMDDTMQWFGQIKPDCNMAAYGVD